LPSLRQTKSRGRLSHPGPPWYSSPLSFHHGPDPPRDNVYPYRIGRQTSGDPFDIPFALPPTDRSGPDRLFRRGAAGPDGRRPQRQNVDWNSQLTTRRGKLLRDYADGNSCLIFGPDSPTTNTYNLSATPDVLDIVIIQNLPFLVYLTSCSALCSDHLPVLIDTACRSSFQHYRIALISGTLTGPNSKLIWKIKFRSIRNCTTGWQSTRALRTSPAPF
jgi:hypothetical protein